MASLFVIGNGFDLSHGIKTSYEDFHQYLLSEYHEAKSDVLIVPFNTTGHHGETVYDDDAIAGFLLYLISYAEPEGDKWSDLENSLGELPFGECFNGISADNRDEDWDPWDDVYRNQDTAQNVEDSAIRIKTFFSDWINTITIDGKTPVNPNFLKLIDADLDLFLIFNYTRTLEILYKAKNVCHIHGTQGEELIFGHGNTEDNYEKNMGRYPGAEGALQHIQTELRKDTGRAISEHSVFFKGLSSVDKIYSYGFSFSEVDIIYIRKICRVLPTEKITWYLNDYNSSQERKEFKRKIKKSGFKGIFDVYKV